MANQAEKAVLKALREALPVPYRLYRNVRWLGKADADSPARDGETDLLIVHPENGLLVVETKGGRIRRDASNRWWSGGHPLDPSPFQQAETSKRNLAQKLTSLPDWPGRPTDLRAGHAVAFPDISARTTATRAVGLGPDTDLDLVIDQVDLESVESARKAVERAYDYWLGDRRRGSELSGRQLELIDELLAPTVELAPMLRPEVEAGEREVVRLTEGQMHVLDVLRGQRRAAVVGPAGSGKQMRARERARRLASEGFSTLLVCFNQPLARMLHAELADAPAPGGLHVTTFHELCLTLGREAGTLPMPEPAEKTQEWWDVILPRALESLFLILADPSSTTIAWYRARTLRATGSDRRSQGWPPPGARCPVRLPRPGSGAVPRGRRGDARAARLHGRLELPQHRTDPRAGGALRGWTGGRRGAAQGGPGPGDCAGAPGLLTAR